MLKKRGRTHNKRLLSQSFSHSPELTEMAVMKKRDKKLKDKLNQSACEQPPP